MPAGTRYDAIIVGGGPAGLSAALVLGRCRRRVLVCDEGHPRNRHTREVHGFLTRDGTSPAELLGLAREQLRPYDVELRRAEVVDAALGDDGFTVTLRDGSRETGRTLLLATGVVDELPPIQGLDALYGRSVHHCPYCDAWEVRDQPLAAYAPLGRGFGIALALTTWSRDVVLCTDGPARLRPQDRDELAGYGIPLFEHRIARLEGQDGILERVVFDTGEAIGRRALFFSTGQHHRSHLPTTLGCRMTSKGTVRTGRLEQAHVPGLYVVGDASHDVQLVVVAAAEGAKAAIAVNEALQASERRARRHARPVTPAEPHLA